MFFITTSMALRINQFATAGNNAFAVRALLNQNGSKNLFTTCQKLIFGDFSIVFVIKLVKIAPQEQNPTFFVHRLSELENLVKGLK